MKTKNQIWSEIEDELKHYHEIQEEIFKIVYENGKYPKPKSHPNIEELHKVFNKEEGIKDKILELFDEMEKAKL